MEKEKENRCKKGTRRYKPFGKDCYPIGEINADIEKKKTQKNKGAVTKKQVLSKEEKEVLSKEEKEVLSEDEESKDEESKEKEESKEEEESKKKEESKEEEAKEEDPEDYGKENDTLNEKEKKEYYNNLKNPESETDFLYPSLGNPYLNKFVSLRKEFAHLKYDGEIKDKRDIKKISDMICKNSEFELLPHQLFVKGFMSSQTPYKSILLYHGLGSGKTCSAIGIAEEMRSYTKQTGINSRIFIVASPNVQDNFRLQLFDERKLKETKGTWSLNTCVGTQILSEINPTNSSMDRDKIISQAKTIINRDYKFMGYLQFANYIEYKINVPQSATAEQELIKKHFSDSLVIIDEVHNCTKESKSLSIQLKKLAKYADNLRFILLSATPMYNSPREIIWITNLMNLNDNRSLIKYSDVFDEAGNLIQSKEDEGEKLLFRKLNGYVSYVRGENPVDVPLQKKLYLTKIENTQKKIYDMIIKKTLDADGLFSVNMNVPNFENMEKYGYTQLQAPLQSLIITFPHNDLTNIIEEGERYAELIGQKGLENNMKFDKKDIKISDEAKITIKCNYEYRSKVPRIFSQEKLPEYSAKISSICDCIRASADRIIEINGEKTTIHGGIVLVYTQYIYGGIVPMALALEEMGFVRYGGKNNVPSLFKKGVITNRIDARTMQLAPVAEFKQAKYMILSGDKYFSQDNAEDIKIATSEANRHGDEVRVILISRAASEGLDFKYIRQVHVLDPWYNLNRIEQIVGRGVRNRSHCGLEFEERNVEIYLHASTNGESETADIYVYRYAEEKAKKIGEVTRLMKSVSTDCVLNEMQNNFTEKEMKAVADEGVVQIVPSTHQELFSYKLGDKPFSEICDYMEDCSYACYPANKIKTKDINELYDKEQISVNSTKIVEKLKTIFKVESAYHFETIESMEVFKNASTEELYYSLTRLIEGPDTIQDKYGRPGRLVNRGAYYIFQPLEVTNPNISLYESKIPVKTMNAHVVYEINENIKTPIFSSEKSEKSAETYDSLIKTIKGRLETATKKEPNELKGKNDDWYYNLNSKKNTDEDKKLADFKKKHKIDDKDLDIQNKLSSAVYNEYETLTKNSVCTKTCKEGEKDKKYIFSVATRLHLFGFTPKLIKKYVTNHILETLSHEEQLILAKKVLTPKFKTADELEKQIVERFQKLLLNGEKTLVLANKDKLVYYHTANWTELSVGEENLLSKKKLEKENYSDIIGFISEFTSKDMEKAPVFKTKIMTQTRNNKGSYLQNESSKIAVIRQLNVLLKNMDSPFSFDDETCVQCERNTDDISKIAFAGIYEMLIRKLDDEKHKGKTWFLTPEEAIYNNITDTKAQRP
jgi:hypothetical protein